MVLNEAGHDAKAIPGEKSQFDVVADRRTVFSKQQVGRFPDADEVLALL